MSNFLKAIIHKKQNLAMKKLNIFLLACSFLFISSVLSAQSELSIGAFKIKKFDFSLGYETDYINDIDYTFFRDQMPEAQQAVMSDLNFRPEDFYSGVCENPSINIGLTLEHQALKNFEWRNSLAYKPNRVDGVSYYNNSSFDGEYLNIHSTHDEFTVESALLFKLPVLQFLNVYVGAGTNLGVTTNNHTCVYTSFDLTAQDISFSNINEITQGVPAGEFGSGDGYNNCFDTGVQMNQRVFGQLGTGIIFFKRIEVGFDMKYGYGYRADFGSSIDGTHIVSTNLNLRYILK